MPGPKARKLLSAIVSAAVVFGVMVIIVEEGPIEMPYYDGTLKNPLTSPQVEALYYTENGYATEAVQSTNAENGEDATDENSSYSANSE